MLIPGYTNPFACILLTIHFQSPRLACAVTFNIDHACQSKVYYIKPSGFHHRSHTGCFQHGFVSSYLQKPSSSDPKEYHLL